MVNQQEMAMNRIAFVLVITAVAVAAATMAPAALVVPVVGVVAAAGKAEEGDKQALAKA